jgi:hypothetical protein
VNNDKRLLVIQEHNLGLPALTGLETTTRYMRWYCAISHPYIIHLHEDSNISRPPELEAINEVVAEEHEDKQWLDFRSRLACVKGRALVSGAMVRWREGSPVGLVCMRFYMRLEEGWSIVVGVVGVVGLPSGPINV